MLILFSCNDEDIKVTENKEQTKDLNTYKGNDTDSMLFYSYEALNNLEKNKGKQLYEEILLDFLIKINTYHLYDDVIKIGNAALQLLAPDNYFMRLKIGNQIGFSLLDSYNTKYAKIILHNNKDENFKHLNNKIIEHEINLYLGTMYYKDEVYDSALFYFSLIDNDKDYENKSLKTMVLNNIGGIYDYLEEYHLAIQYFNRALKMAQESNDKFYASLCLNNIGSSYLALDSLNLAAIYLDKSIEIRKEKEYFNAISSPLSNRGLVYERQGQQLKALEYYLQALYYDSTYYNVYGMMVSNNNIAKVYLDLKNYNKAYFFAHKNIELFEISSNIGVIKDTYRILSFCYKAQNKIEEAYNSLLLYSVYYDSVYNENRMFQLEKMDAIYKLSKTENDLNDIKTEKEAVLLLLDSKEKQTRYLMLLILLIAIIVVFLVFAVKNTRKRHKLEQLYLKNATEKAIIELNHKLFTSQINSHFISNILNGIQSLYVNGNTYDASQYLSKFNLLLRSLLESSFVKTESLINSITFLKLYLELEKMRFGNRLTYTINVAENIDPSDIFLPPLIFQPFIENSIKHGFKLADNHGFVTASFTLIEDYLHFEIIDNGIGYSNSINQKNKQIIQKGNRGLKLSRDRIELWGKELNKQTRFEINDYAGNAFKSGTVVNISIPFINDDSEYED